MAISGNLTINIGLPNESTGSDSLYTAFNKINTNFDTLFGNASKVVAGNGIKITNNLSNTVIEANLIAGNGIALQQSNGAITIINTGGGGNGTAGISGMIPGGGILVNGANSPVYEGNVTLSLANSNVTPAVYSNPVITVDQYGRITSAANSTVTGTVTSVGISPGPGISVAGGPITSNGIITVTNTGVTRLSAGPGITLSGNTGNIQISSTGGGGSGVTSVGISSSQLVIGGSPIVGAGTITVNLPNNLSIVGTVSAGGFAGNGSGLTGVSVAVANVTGIGNIATYNLDGNASNVLHGDGTWSADVTNYSNSNVAAYLPTYTGNIKAGNASLGNAATANYFIGNFYGTANTATSATTAGTVTTAAQPNITSVGTLSSLTITGNLAAGNANLGNLVKGNFFQGDGGLLTNISVAAGSQIISGNSNVSVAANSNVSVGVAGNANVFVVTGTGANVTGTFNVTGNANVGNLGATQGIFTNVSGNGSSLSSLTGANVTGQVSFAATANAVAGANVSGQVGNALVAGTVYTNSQPNITSVGTLSSLAVTGNVTAGNVYANSGTIGSNVIVANTISGSLTTNAQPNITSVGLLASLSVTGNIGANNVNLDGVLKTTVLLYSELPSAVTIGAGSRSFISDGNLVASGNFGAIVSGGASNNVPVYSDGTNWRIG